LPKPKRTGKLVQTLFLLAEISNPSNPVSSCLSRRMIEWLTHLTLLRKTILKPKKPIVQQQNREINIRNA
jgi:hypothetical protein